MRKATQAAIDNNNSGYLFCSTYCELQTGSHLYMLQPVDPLRRNTRINRIKRFVLTTSGRLQKRKRHICLHHSTNLTALKVSSLIFF